MKHLSAFLLLALCSLALAVPPLFDNGKSTWEIVISPAASEPEQYAAEELQVFLKKISGVSLPVTTTLKADVPAIVLGTLETVPELAQYGVTKEEKKEQMLLRLEGNRFYLGGNFPRSAVYAVYLFLRDELGCRWFWPGDEGEFVPQRTTYTLPVMQRLETFAFRYRTMSPCAMHRHIPTEIWQARNFLNQGSRSYEIRRRTGMIGTEGGHVVSMLRRQFSEHPELFALISGERTIAGTAGCWSDPRFTDLIVKKIVKLANDNHAYHLNCFPADVIPRCECENCTKIKDRSARWYTYYGKLIKLIQKEIPQATFSGIAYMEYRQIPSCDIPKEIEYIQHCQYSRCYVHKITDPTCKLNVKTLAELKRWLTKSPMGIYGYEYDTYLPNHMLEPSWNMIQEEAKLYRDLGLVYMKTELWVRWGKNIPREEQPQQIQRLPYYLYTRLICDPDASIDALIDDWCTVIYGEAASPMGEYYRKMAQAWDSMKIHLTYFGLDPSGTSQALLNDNLIKDVHALFDKAKSLAKENPRALTEIGIEESTFRKWETYYHEAKECSFNHKLPYLEGKDRFAEVDPIVLRYRNKKPSDRTFKMYWDKDALHIQVTTPVADMSEVTNAPHERDGINWGKRHVEIFLDDGKNAAPFWQLAANSSGIIYDAHGADSSWNPDWKAESNVTPGLWIYTATIPFASLGTRTPETGDVWKMVLDNNHAKEPAGFPFPLYHDIASGVNVEFVK